MPYADIEKKKEMSRKYRETHKDELSLYFRKRYLQQKDKCLARNKANYTNNREHNLMKMREYHKTHKTERRSYVEKRRLEIREYDKKYYHNRKLEPEYKLRRALRSRLSKAIKGHGEKSTKTLLLIGCTIPELKLHLEQRFKQGMSWDNYGLHGWHIDHIIPCASFDLSDPEQQRACFNFSNLQPLWASENLEKGDKVVD